MIEPVRKLHIFVAMAARLLPGVRCSTLCTVYSSPWWRMVIPGRTCVARIQFAPDAYGISWQAVVTRCDLVSRGSGGPEVSDQRRAALQDLIINAGHRTVNARRVIMSARRTPKVRHSEPGSAGEESLLLSLRRRVI